MEPWTQKLIPEWCTSYLKSILSAILQRLFIFIIQIMMICDHSFKHKKMENQKVKGRMISCAESRYKYQHVLFEIKIMFCHQFFNEFYLYHADKIVVWSLIQIQNNWGPKTLEQGRYQAMNPVTNTSM